VEGLPAGWHSRRQAAAREVRADRARIRRRKFAGRLSSAVVIVAALGLALPAAAAGADPASPNPTLKQLLAAAAKLSQQIDALSQQYDALRIQYNEAKAQVKVAHLTLARDQGLLAASRAAIAQIAAAGYMTGGVNPAVSLLESKNPQSMLDRASILGQLQKENGAKLQLVTSARQAAQRARLMALQQERQAAKLSAAMHGKVAKIQAKQNKLNSAAFAKALQIYRQTGKYPPIQVNGSSLEIHALRIAMSAIGDSYSWGAAGPTTFDCSGLVVWAYAQLGVSLPHYTGWLWNSGVHLSRSQLRPGDLVFFFAGISHVGFYVGHGFMLDAPTYGIPVGIHKMLWGAYDGAVRIA
jgi:peptidoglycan DL-endopeptidase CwlO